jgi:hypothetical protein
MQTRGQVVLRRTGIALAVVATTAALTGAPALAAKHPSGMDVIKAGDMHGQIPAKGAKPARHSSSPNMTSHGGPIMTSVSKVYPIYWGTTWANYTGDKISGLSSFYSGYSNSNYAKTSDEYKGTNGQVGPTVSGVQAAIVDASPAPSHAPSTTTILAEVQKYYPTPAADGYYPVYVDTKRGGAQYCAWHSFGTIGGKGAIFAFFFNLDGDAGCDPSDTATGHSQGLAALGNVSAHELSEARTDPDASSGWYDASGAENADKCAWSFNVQSVPLGSQAWKLQGEWSNNAYTNGSGYPNNSGQKGCLDGH